VCTSDLVPFKGRCDNLRGGRMRRALCQSGASQSLRCTPAFGARKSPDRGSSGIHASGTSARLGGAAPLGTLPGTNRAGNDRNEGSSAYPEFNQHWSPGLFAMVLWPGSCIYRRGPAQLFLLWYLSPCYSPFMFEG
jgi:hypothetical protein